MPQGREVAKNHTPGARWHRVSLKRSHLRPSQVLPGQSPRHRWRINLRGPEYRSNPSKATRFPHSALRWSLRYRAAFALLRLLVQNRAFDSARPKQVLNIAYWLQAAAVFVFVFAHEVNESAETVLFEFWTTDSDFRVLSLKRFTHTMCRSSNVFVGCSWAFHALIDCRLLRPLSTRGRSSAGRVVNVASMAGHLSILKDRSRRDAFTDPALTK